MAKKQRPVARADMKIRRIVTVEDESGKSRIASCGDAPRTHDHVHVPGMSNTRIWSTSDTTALGGTIVDPTTASASVLPSPGETRFLVVAFPPDSVMRGAAFDPVLAHEENLQVIPGLAERFEADNPGMHRTDTVDYCIVLQGPLVLELDDGVQTELRQHDVVIQNGTRHAWRNPGSHIAVMAFVLVGADRRPQQACLSAGPSAGTPRELLEKSPTPRM
jgi:hypothetical protein